MSDPGDYPYKTYLNVRFKPLEVVDVPALVEACTDAWYNQTLTRVNEAVVRLGVFKGAPGSRHGEDAGGLAGRAGPAG